MDYLVVEFLCRLQSEANFPLYTGSMLRGALGVNLRSAVCMMKGKECQDCMLVQSCIFPKLFTSIRAPAESLGAPLLPPPFCIEPPKIETGIFAQGELFTFRLKLFAYAVEYLPFFIHAWTLAGNHGLGRGINQGYGRFVIEDVRQNGVSIYDASKEQLHPLKPEILTWPSLKPSSEDTALQIELMTPLRCKQANHLATDLPFSLLMRLIIRRLNSLHALEGQAFRLSTEEFQALQDVASQMQVQSNTLHWHDWQRYSGRQKTVMQLGGLVGNVSYYGPASAFSEYLDFASKVHLGKQISFGLGAVRVVADKPD